MDNSILPQVSLSVRFLCTVFLILFYTGAPAQEKVTFKANDGLMITADLYIKDYNYPFILLFHQADYSRGEYSGIAPKLLNLNYNCLAVDLRSGGKVNYIENETAKRAKQYNYPHALFDSRKDIQAAIDYVSGFSGKQVILFGSSFSASLCILSAMENPKVKAVVAFSPGEYFSPGITIKEQVHGFDKPIFVASTQEEYNYLVKLLDEMTSKEKSLFKPKNGDGEHGAKALWESNKTYMEYWLELFIFFKKIKD